MLCHFSLWLNIPLYGVYQMCLSIYQSTFGCFHFLVITSNARSVLLVCVFLGVYCHSCTNFSVDCTCFNLCTRILELLGHEVKSNLKHHNRSLRKLPTWLATWLYDFIIPSAVYEDSSNSTPLLYCLCFSLWPS